MTESVYDLLPKELQLQPSSTQTDLPTMSQKSGGEVGPPPSAALASGELTALYVQSLTLSGRVLGHSLSKVQINIVLITSIEFQDAH